MIDANYFPEIFNVLEKHGLITFQHEIMDADYRITISQALSKYDNGKLTGNFYSDLAWSGLFDSESFRELDDKEEKRIEDFILDYQKTKEGVCE